MPKTHRFSVSVSGIVVNDEGKVLAIQRRDNGHWEPPGGVLEIGERIEDAATREILEETGYTVHAERLTGVYQNLARDIVSLVYRCSIVAGNARVTEESTVVQWLDMLSVEHLMDEAYSVRVTDALESDGIAIVRAHDGVNLV